MSEHQAIISAYSIDIGRVDEIRIERARQIEGPALWAVRFRGDCLNKRGVWEWEPRPSSRDDDFLERCRFASAEEAIEAARRNLAAPIDGKEA